MSLTPNLVRWLGLAMLAWLFATITVTMQSWVGDSTIYSKALEDRREVFHFAVLTNTAPGGGSWGAVGALSIQKRVGIVYLAEFIRSKSGWAVGKVYKLLDSIFLLATLIALYFYLKNWVPDTYALLGTLYFSATLPLTYFFQLFHPWDRAQLFLWIVLLWLTFARRFIPLALVLVLSVVVKFDTVLLPLLYGVVHYSRQGRARLILETGCLLALAFGTYVALGMMFPAPLDTSHFNWESVKTMYEANASALAELTLRYPPLLVHALPLFLGLLFFRAKARFVWASAAFGIGLACIYAVFIHFEEVRTHMVVLVLLLPSALISLQRLMAARETAAGMPT